MSRGPGRWQRTILAALNEAENFYLVDVLPNGYTKAQYNAAHRAAMNLVDDGRISMTRFLCGGGRRGGLKTVLGKPGTNPQRPPRVKCWTGDTMQPVQHLVVDADD
jgi:hypothetical protein